MRQLRHAAARDDRRRSLVDDFDGASLGDDDAWTEANRRIQREGTRLQKALDAAKAQLESKKKDLPRKPRGFDENASVRESVRGQVWLMECAKTCGAAAKSGAPHHPTMGYPIIFDAVIYVGFSFSVITT